MIFLFKQPEPAKIWVPTEIKIVETESSPVVARGWEKEKARSPCLMSAKLSILQVEKSSGVGW